MAVIVFLIEIIKIPTATLLVLIYLFIRMIPQFSTIQSSYQYVLNMLPAYKNVENLEKQFQDNSEYLDETKTPPLERELTLENMKFSYQNDHFALDNLNLRIAAGRTTALAGPSGAGKAHSLTGEWISTA